MKATIEVDLGEAFVGYGYDGEEYSADFGDMIQTSVIEHIIKTRASHIDKSIDDAIKNAVGKIADETVENKIKKMFDNFMESPITISDGYRKEEYNTLIEYVEKKFSELYKSELNGSSCSKDKLVSVISNKIKQDIKSELSATTKQVEIMGQNIARNTIKNDTTLLALKNLLKDN